MLLNGEGYQATATETTQQWVPSKSGANNLSCFNAGLVSVYVLANCTAEEFDLLHADGKSIIIRAGMAFNFNGDQYVNIRSVCYRAESSTADIDFAAF